MEFPASSYECPSSFTSRGSRQSSDYFDNKEYDFIKNQADNSFSKTFNLKCEHHNWKLPDRKTNYPPNYEKWQISELYLLKKRLNATKSKLNTFNLAEWHKHTNYMNPAGLVLSHLRSYNIELLTQAWCKFFELLNVFKLVPDKLEGNFNSVHLCEAPGAFIASLNHYIQTKNANIKWSWIANTLNPYYEGNGLDEMINDDRFIFKTLDNWWFGEDYTGNIRVKKNMDSLEHIVSRIDPIHIVTADGSVDCLKNPAEQEAHVFALHYAEVLAALKILNTGGSFVIKIFTIFECETVCLLYLLCSVFGEVTLHKPVVSKEGNSEVYVICCNYIGKEVCCEILTNMNISCEVGQILFSKEELPNTFIHQIINCSSFFTNLQIEVLEKNIKSYKNKMPHKRKMLLRRVRDTVAELFIQKFSVSSLPDQSCFIIRDKSLEKTFNHVPKNEEGTFQERQELLHIDKNSCLLRNREILLSFKEHWHRPKIFWFHLNEINLINFKPIIGKPIVQIKSSKFCRGNLITIINDLERFGNLVPLKIADQQSSLVEYIPDFSSDYNVCVISNENFMTNFYHYQIESLKTIVTELKKVPSNGNFIVSGLTLLTQFSVGIAYFIGLAFTEVGIVCPEDFGYTLVYKNLTNSTIFIKLHELLDNYFYRDIAVLSVIPLTLLCDGEWNRCVTSVNHIALKDMALKKISSLLSKNGLLF